MQAAEGSRKPSSVQRAIHLGRRSPGTSCGLPGDHHAAGRHSPLLGLAPGGVCRAPAVTRTGGGLLLHRFTLTGSATLARRLQAVCSLWHFPSAFAARVLPGTLPCGARTFLEPRAARRRSAAPRPPRGHRNITATLRRGQGCRAGGLIFHPSMSNLPNTSSAALDLWPQCSSSCPDGVLWNRR